MKTMVLVAHPNLETSRANRAFMLEISKHPNLHVRNLYHEYPNWTFDIEKEQQLLLAYDRIVLQFPFYWYSCPPLLKNGSMMYSRMAGLMDPEAIICWVRNSLLQQQQGVRRTAIEQVETIGSQSVSFKTNPANDYKM